MLEMGEGSFIKAGCNNPSWMRTLLRPKGIPVDGWSEKGEPSR